MNKLIIEVGKDNKVIAMKGYTTVSDIRSKGILCGSVPLPSLTNTNKKLNGG